MIEPYTPPKAPDKRLLTLRETARMLSISERTLGTLTKSGRLPVIRMGRAVRVDVRDIEAFIEAEKQTPDLPAPS
jgi:excisionase family DNA binding protein